VFAFGVGTDAFIHAAPAAIAAGMQLTFLLASGMMLVAIGIAFVHRSLAKREL
jgi:mannose/fructose/N-acetylgalactosamine-specific phosphotransferase system component IIC